MDDNTTKVLMAVIALISTVVTPLVVVYVGKMNSLKIKEVKEDVAVYRKEVNGHMSALLDKTEQLATATATATEKAKHVDESGTAPIVPGTTHLKIVEGEIKVKTEKPKKP